MKNALDTHIKAYDGKTQYDFDNNILLNWYARRIIKLTKNAKSILELGLGHGITTKIFAKHFKRHVVLEGSRVIIDNFKKNFFGCTPQIINTYFEQFISEEKFDLIVMGFVLEHVDSPLEILTRFKKFLATNGKMFIAVPNAEVLNRRLGYKTGILSNLQELSEYDIALGHKRYFTIHSLTEKVIKAGYKIEKIEGIYLKPFTTRQILSLNLDRKMLKALCEIGIDYPELCCGILLQVK